MNHPTAKQLAVKWLASSEKTEAELRNRLEQRGFSEDEIASALHDLVQGGWLDDQRVLDRDMEQSRARPDQGREKTRASLLKRGFSPERVDESLKEWSERDETAKAEALLASRLKPGDSPGRAARLLASRGFGEGAIRAALERRFPDWES